LPSFGAESFVFQFAIKKYSLRYKETYFACRFACMWNLVTTLLWERKLRVFKNRVLRRIFQPKDKVNGSGEDYISRSLMICTHHQIFCRISNQE